MGTSNRNDGSIKGKGLSPSWLSDGNGGQPPTAGGGQMGSLQGPRKGITGGIKSNSKSSLSSAVSNYIKKSLGGTKAASKRMGVSKVTAGSIAGLYTAIRDNNLEGELINLHMSDIIDKPIEEAFGYLTDVLCPDGGEIDTSIVRKAWTNAVLDFIDQAEGKIMSEVSPEDMEFVFKNFIANTILVRAYNDIGKTLIVTPDNLQNVNDVEEQLKSIIFIAVDTSMSSVDMNRMRRTDISNIVDDIYERTYGFLSDISGSVK